MEERILKAFGLVRKAVKGGRAVYEYMPGNKIGSITLTGKEIRFSDAFAFLEAAGLANNFEVYPKTDGTVQMNLTFFDDRTEE